MAQSVRQHIASLPLASRRRRRNLAAFVLAAVAVSLSVAGLLSRNGIALTHEETVLDCPVPGGEHTHTDACYAEDGSLTCGLEEHTHGPGCYKTITVEDEGSAEEAAAAAVAEPAPAGEATTPAPAEQPESATPAQTLTYEDPTIKVTANVHNAPDLPASAKLKVALITPQTEGYNYDAYMQALQAQSAADVSAQNTLLFDVAIMDGSVEWEPTDGGKVELSLVFKDNQLTDQIGVVNAETVTVTHLPIAPEVMEQYDSTREATDISSEDIEPEPVDASVSGDAARLSFEVEALSVISISNADSTVNVTLNLDANVATESMTVKNKKTYAYLASVDSNGNINSSTKIYGSEIIFNDSHTATATVTGVPIGNYKLILAYKTNNDSMQATGDYNTLQPSTETRYAEEGGYFFGLVYHEPNPGDIQTSGSTYNISAKLNTADSPDSLNGISLKSIMDRALNYGITANEFENMQESFANYAVKKATVTNQNAGGGNYFSTRAGNIVIPYIIADLACSQDADEVHRLHSGDHDTNFYVTETDASKVTSADNSNTIVRDKNEIEDRVEIMISNVLKQAKKLFDNATLKAPKMETLDFSAYPDGAMINLDADALDGLDKNFTIVKRPNQTIVFNFSGANPVPPMNVKVTLIDDDGSEIKTYTAGDDMKDAPKEDGDVWNKVIWNFPNAEKVETRNNIGGIYITPGDFSANKGGGWIVSHGKVTIQNPWYGFPGADEPFKRRVITKTFMGLDPSDSVDPNYILRLWTHRNESTSGTTNRRLIADLVVKPAGDSTLTNNQVGYTSMERSADGSTIVVSWTTPPLSVGNEHKLEENNSKTVNGVDVKVVEFVGPYSFWSAADDDYIWEIREKTFVGETAFNNGDGVFNVSTYDDRNGQDRLHVYVTNRYEDKDSYSLTVKKQATGDEPTPQPEYRFILSFVDDKENVPSDTTKYNFEKVEIANPDGAKHEGEIAFARDGDVYKGEFTLRSGQQIKIDGLPKKWTYTLSEIKDDGAAFSTFYSGGGSVINDGKAYQETLTWDKTAEVTNAYKEKPVTKDIVASKTLIGGNLGAGEFTFTLTEVDADDQPVENGVAMTVTNGISGGIALANVSDILFKDAVSLTSEDFENGQSSITRYYRINEVIPDQQEEGMTYASNSVYAVVTASIDDQGVITISDPVYRGGLKEEGRLTGEWVPDTENPLIGKLRVNVSDVTLGEDGKVSLRCSDPEINQSVEPAGGYAVFDVNLSSVFSDSDAGGTTKQCGFVVSTGEHSAVVNITCTKGQEAHGIVHNSYIGDFAFSYTVEVTARQYWKNNTYIDGGYPSQAKLHITMKAPQSQQDVAYRYYFSSNTYSYETKQYNGIEKDQTIEFITRDFYLSEFENLYFIVDEYEAYWKDQWNKEYKPTGKTSKTAVEVDDGYTPAVPATSSLMSFYDQYTSRTIDPLFVNERTVTKVNVMASKTVIGLAADREFNFEFGATIVGGIPEGASCAVYDASGKIRDVSLGGDALSFSLSNGQYVLFTGLDVNQTVTITETAKADFTASVADATLADSRAQVTPDGSSVAIVPQSGTASVAFTNTRNQQQLRGKKTAVGGESQNGLVGAEFQLQNKDGSIVARTSTITSDSEGAFTVGDLSLGTYYLVETKAPAGYNPLTHRIEIVVTSTGITALAEADADAGESQTRTGYDISGPVDGVFTITVPNNPGVELPSTGGPGNAAFTITGTAVIAGALACLLVSRRRREGRSVM